jgi:hypothetical protein
VTSWRSPLRLHSCLPLEHQVLQLLLVSFKTPLNSKLLFTICFIHFNCWVIYSVFLVPRTLAHSRVSVFEWINEQIFLSNLNTWTQIHLTPQENFWLSGLIKGFYKWPWINKGQEMKLQHHQKTKPTNHGHWRRKRGASSGMGSIFKKVTAEKSQILQDVHPAIGGI